MNENEGFVDVRVIFSNGSPGEFQLSVTLTTINETATGHLQCHAVVCRHAIITIQSTEGRDFASIMPSQVTFSAGNRVSSETISIISDNATEGSEKFAVTLESVTLILSGNGSALEISNQECTRLVLQPARANITIMDDDGDYYQRLMY